MEAYLGMISAFGFNFAPQGWAQCAGQVLSISQNSALFALLGTTYGGNGQTTFQLPDLRGRAPVGQGQGPGLANYTIGQASGTENTTLLITNLPAHTHTATASSTSQSTSASTLSGLASPATAAAPNGHVLANSGVDHFIYGAPGGTLHALDASSIATTTNTTTNTTVAVQPAGGSQPFSILSPYLCINYCICTSGIFPSRN